MIPAKETTDPLGGVLSGLESITSDPPLSRPEAKSNRDMFLEGLRALGEDHAWDLVAGLDDLASRYHVSVFRTTLLCWASKHAKPDVSRMDSGMFALLGSVYPQPRGRESSMLGMWFDVFAEQVSRFSGHAHKPGDTSVLSENTGILVGRLARRVADVEGCGLFPMDIVAVVGIRNLADIIEGNPSVVDFPDEWLMPALSSTLLEHARAFIMESTDMLPETRFEIDEFAKLMSKLCDDVE